MFNKITVKKRKMNANLTRNKQNHMTVGWEPFATSTPLKVVPNNLKIEQVFQKQLLLYGTPVNVVDKLQNGFANSVVLQNKCTGSNLLHPKGIRKNSSTAYFDILTTSSSDEDESSENKKRPIIKLSSKKKIRALSSFKKSVTDETDILNKGEAGSKAGDYKKLKTTADKHAFSTVKDFGHKSKSPRSKNEVQRPAPRPSSSFRSKSFSSDEENKIFGETRPCKISVSTINSRSRNKENVIKIASVNENLEKNKEQCLKGVHEISDIPVKSIKMNIFEEEKGLCGGILEDNEINKTSKKKTKKVTNSTDPVKRTRRRKIPATLSAEPLQPIGNSEILLPAWKKNHNESHQLFTDSKEQEFINMLDLTRDKNNEAEEAKKCSVTETENDLPLKSFMSPHPSIQNICSNEIKTGRPKRTKQTPKKFWLPEHEPDKPLLIASTKKQKKLKKNSHDPTLEAQVIKKLKKASTSKDNLTKNAGTKQTSTKRQKSNKKGKRTEKVVVEPYIVLTDNEVNLEDAEENHTPSKTYRSDDEGSNMNSFRVPEDGTRINLDKQVFQRLNELSYKTKKNEAGCSLDQCWNLNNFKCGIFRLKIKAQFACKTSHKNSYLGGVLVKGDLRMEIGDKDLHLKEGDMAFVPPLTKWQATNIGDCDSVFYYWSGRFP